MTNIKNNKNQTTAITHVLNKAVYLDSECYPNYYSIGFLSGGKRKYYEIRGSDSFTTGQIEEIKHIMSNYVTIGFNSNEYDVPLLSVALAGANTATLKNASDKLIHKEKGVFAWQILAAAQVPKCKLLHHIDIFKVAPSLNTSLKTYAARMGFKKLQDLPYEPDTVLTEQQMDEVQEYCFNDIEVTEALTYRIEKELELRYYFSEQYQVDLMSKSDASIAETVFNTKYNIPYIDGVYSYDKPYIKYSAPEYIQFSTKPLKELFESIKNNEYKLDEEGKLINIPYTIKIGDSTYTIGVGGMHSKEKNVHFDSNNKILADIDVVSYYPNIVINNRYVPSNYPSSFIEDYKKFYDERLAAKATGDIIKSSTCKIILNGTFGKLGSMHSSLYAPNLLLNVTLTGQLSLLMLIEELEQNTIAVVSANTDGILASCDKSNEFVLKAIINKWEERCNLKTTFTNYKDVYKTSVNNYIAIKPDGKLTTKGVLQYSSLCSNSIDIASRDAVVKYLKDNTPIEETIESMTGDIRNFLIFKKSKDGAYYKGQSLGKTARWYYAKDGDVILKGNGNKVQESQGAIPLMEIPEELNIGNIDISRYIQRSYKLLHSLGVT